MSLIEACKSAHWRPGWRTKPLTPATADHEHLHDHVNVHVDVHVLVDVVVSAFAHGPGLGQACRAFALGP